MASILAVVNQKGGVGKTTIAINLSACLAEKGLEVLLIDCDPQASATMGLLLQPPPSSRSLYAGLLNEARAEDLIVSTATTNFYLLPSHQDLAGLEVELLESPDGRIVLRHFIQTLPSNFDWIVLDSPPSLTLMTINCFVAADYLLIPVICDFFSLQGLGRLMETLRLIQSSWNPALSVAGIVRTFYDGRTNLAQAVSSELDRHFPQLLLQTTIPRTVRLAEAPSHGLPIILYEAHGVAANAFRRLTEEILDKIHWRPGPPPVPFGGRSHSPAHNDRL
ncbi:MAG: ParA family protein [Armatimonadetes bacterium]|nr:ParA family protein [Armatimonadota bacterium]MDW8121400.1 ParA family protein [Armatimonadota bacterium]